MICASRDTRWTTSRPERLPSALPLPEARSGIRFEYVPVLLGGLFKLANNRSPAEANADIPNKRAYEALELQRFVHRHSLTRFRMNPHFMPSLLVKRALIWLSIIT